MQHWKEDGFSFVDCLIAIAILGVLISLAVPGISGVRDGITVAKLKSDVDTVNFAIDGFLARGGSLAGVEDPNAILDAIRNHQTVTKTLQHFPAEADSMIDARLTARLQTREESNSGRPRAVWNAAMSRFDIATTGSGVGVFLID